MLGIQNPNMRRDGRSSVPPGPPKNALPLIDRMTSLPQRKLVSGIWKPPEMEAGPPEVSRIIFTVRNTFGAADIMLATTSLACGRQGGKMAEGAAAAVLQRSFRSLSEGAREHLENVMEELASVAIGLVESDGGRVEKLRQSLAETVRMGNYVDTDRIVQGKDSRFSGEDAGYITKRMFLASANAMRLLPANQTEDAFLAMDGVVSWMASATCTELMHTMSMATAKGQLMIALKEAKTYTNNEDGLYRALKAMKRDMAARR